MHKKQGLIGIIFIIILLIATFTYFSIDLRSVFESELFTTNLQFVISVLQTIWTDFLQGPAIWIWENVLQPYVFEPIKGLLSGIEVPKANTPTGPEISTSTEG